MEIVETDRLIIRKFREEDWEDLFEYLSDEEVVHFEPYDVFSAEACKEETAYRAKHETFLAVCLKDTGKVIGNLYFEKQDFGTYEIGYVFNRAYQGKGYATESAIAIINHSMRYFGARRIVAKCNPENRASWELLERIGMRREGHLIRNIWFRRGEDGEPRWLDTYEYGVLASEWSH